MIVDLVDGWMVLKSLRTATLPSWVKVVREGDCLQCLVTDPWILKNRLLHGRNRCKNNFSI